VKYIKDPIYIDADDADDTKVPTALYEARIAELEQKIIELPPGFDAGQKAELQLGIAALMLEIERNDEAFQLAREAFDVFQAAENWEAVVRACDLMYQAEQPESLSALGQGIWLGVTFPEVDPELTVAMLQHVIDETPDDSDGAALAAATARYIVDLRCEGKQHEDLAFFTGQMLGNVARRHSDVENQAQFEYWVENMELDKPEVFLPRMRSVINIMIGPEWWIDPDQIQSTLPDN
jgi:hypothetical protein